MGKLTTLETPRLLLKPISTQHIHERYLSWLNDSQVNKYMSTKDYTMESLISFVNEHIQKETLFWGIHLKNSNKHIGNIKIDPIDSEKRSGEYGIMIGDKTSWGKGYAKEASLAIINYCFEEADLNQVTLGVIKNNEKAVKLYENMGFKAYAHIQSKENGEDALRMKKKHPVNKLILGTAQFGLNYGINNRSGKPSQQKVNNVLNLAHQLDIKILDSAEAYGDSLDMIGLYHKATGKKFEIISKFGKLSFDRLYDQLIDNINRTATSILYSYMYHSYSTLKNNSSTYDRLKELCRQGLIEKVGISIYTNEELSDIVKNYDFDLIQLPFNLLDNESIKGDLLREASSKGIEIHARSIFLQGLFLMKIDEIPDYLSTLKPYITEINALAQDNHLSIAELAMLYVLSKPYIDGIVLGVDNPSQLQYNYNSITKLLPSKLARKIDEINVKHTHLLNPAHWTN